MFSRKQKKLRNSFKAFSKVKKIVIGSIVGFFIIMLLATGFKIENSDSSSGGVYNKQQYIELVDRPPIISTTNPDGSVNGLNLMLINNIATEGYVKEYLQILSKSQDGTLTPDCSVKSKVERILGVSVCESGTYENSGGMIPQSFLPWEDSKKSPKWDKSNKITLTDSTSTSYNSGKISRNQSGGVTATGVYVGPFQQAKSYFSYNGAYRPSTLNGEGQTVGRKQSDYMYFPDEVGGVNWEYSGHLSTIYTEFDKSLLSADGLEVLKTLAYAGGSMTDSCPGATKSERTKSANDLAEYCNELKKTYESISKSNKITDYQEFKWMASAMIILDGGVPSEKQVRLMNISFQKQSINDFIAISGNGKSFSDIVNKSDSSISTYDGDATGCIKVVHNGFTHYLVPESFAHYLGEIMIGPIMYARMLKFAGVNVDPTNPTTYMNQITQSSGQWVPSGNADWVENEGLDKSKMNDKRFKILNLASTVLGGPYKQADPIWPTKNSNGTWNGYVDCSAYVELSIKNILGIDISRTTFTQVVNPNLEEITYSELKPGDLIYYYDNGSPEHVGFCLKPVGNGRCNIMNAASPTLGIKINHNYTQGTSQKYFRVKGIDNP